MKAMILTGIHQMEMRDVPKPDIINDTDVMIRIEVVGVCGSDIHYYKTGRIGSQVVDYPFVVGHECAGVVEDVGPGTQLVKPGDRVAVDPAIWCGECDQCRAGRNHTCRNLKFLGCPGQAEGSLKEYIVMPEASLLVLKRDTSIEQGALSEPLSIGLYAIRQAGILGNKKIGILGFGPIGMSVLKAAQTCTPDKLYVTDKIEERLEMASAAGADWTGNPDKQDVVTDIHEKEPLELDVVFECCGQQEAIDQAIDLLKPGGVLMLIGIPEADQICFSPEKIRRKEISIINVRRQVDCVQPVLDMIDNRMIKVDDMLTHRFSFEQSKEAFDLVEGYQDGVMKAMIYFNGTAAD